MTFQNYYYEILNSDQEIIALFISSLPLDFFEKAWNDYIMYNEPGSASDALDGFVIYCEENCIPAERIFTDYINTTL